MSGRGPPRGANRSGARAWGKCARAAAPRVARTAQRGRGAAARGVAADQRGGRPQRVRKAPVPFRVGDRQQGNSTGKAKPKVAGATEPQGSQASPPRKYNTSGASYLQSPAPGTSEQVIKPNNAVIDTACINRIEAAKKLVGLPQAIGLESISESGYFAALAPHTPSAIGVLMFNARI